MWYELTDFEWAAIRPFLPNKPRGIAHPQRYLLASCAQVLPGAILRETYGPPHHLL
jgi:hypothetical protein